MSGDKATLPIRVIRSFEHRNIKHFVMKNVDLDQHVEDFLVLVKQELQRQPSMPPPVKTYAYDTLKIQHKAHGSKTSDPTINTEDDDKLILKADKTLLENSVETETELSFFMMDDYLKYKENPHITW